MLTPPLFPVFIFLTPLLVSGRENLNWLLNTYLNNNAQTKWYDAMKILQIENLDPGKI